MIKVVNVKWFRGEIVYIGRKCGEWKGSLLGNPYKIGVDGDRDEVIRKYKVWIWNEYKKGGEVKNEVDRLVDMYKKGCVMNLGCWCFPEKCHGDVLVDFIKYLSK